MTKFLGLESAQGKPILNAASRADLLRSDVPYGFSLSAIEENISGLLKFQMKCVLLQLAYMQSNYDYTKKVTGSGLSNTFYGKYQTSASLLLKYGYIDSTSTWLGKDGIFVEEEFLGTAGLQDLIVQTFFESAYPSLIQTGAIMPGDTAEVVAGMLLVAYQLHADDDYAYKALNWRVTGVSQIATNSPAYIYYNAGRYAVVSLAADTTG